MIYDKSGNGRRLGRYCRVSLAWWHSYKWATKKILQVFACDFFAPLFHHLFPERKFNPGSSSLSANATLLSYVRLAYPHFKAALDNALKVTTLDIQQRTILQNMFDMCNCFIPVVIIYVFNCKFKIPFLQTS